MVTTGHNVSLLYYFDQYQKVSFIYFPEDWTRIFNEALVMAQPIISELHKLSHDKDLLLNWEIGGFDHILFNSYWGEFHPVTCPDIFDAINGIVLDIYC